MVSHKSHFYREGQNYWGIRKMELLERGGEALIKHWAYRGRGSDSSRYLLPTTICAKSIRFVSHIHRRIYTIICCVVKDFFSWLSMSIQQKKITHILYQQCDGVPFMFVLYTMDDYIN